MVFHNISNGNRRIGDGSLKIYLRTGSSTTIKKARGNYCIVFPVDIDKMIVEVNNSGGKIAPYSDLRLGTANIISSKARNKRIATWNVRSFGVCKKLDNVKLEMKPLK